MSNDMQLRLTGSGGQGVILASIIIADAALLAGKRVAQSQSYGPEARGGSCRAEVLISEDEIGFTKVTAPTFVMALTEQAAEKQKAYADGKCVFLLDESLPLPDGADEKHIVRAPILKTAREVVGKAFTANIVAVAVINKLLGIASEQQLMQCVFAHVPKGTEDINAAALAAGEKIAADIGCAE